ncbi:MAG: YicC/YloC family endoribonuclease [Planctomycetota bacterium]|jgi:uncharacterized protein (TIGR00255 family)
MTGFGSATRTRSGVSATAEVRSVNNRFLRISIRSPGVLAAREHDLDALVRERVARGTVYVTLRVVREQHPVRVRMNEPAVEEYLKLFRRVQKAAGLEGAPSLELLAQVPGVFEAEEIEATISDEGFQVVAEATTRALDQLVAMRKREGANLKRDFVRRRTSVAGIVRDLKKRSPHVAKENIARLEDRISRLLEGRDVEIAEKDLIRELAIMAERSDVTEEVTRLASHLDQYAQALKSDEEVGRRLDFLIQEMLREANTIGAKSADVEMSRLCVELKVELDRLKEQVQNVE